MLPGTILNSLHFPRWLVLAGSLLTRREETRQRRDEMKCSSSYQLGGKGPRLDRPWHCRRQQTANRFHPRQNSRPDVRRHDLEDTRRLLGAAFYCFLFSREIDTARPVNDTAGSSLFVEPLSHRPAPRVRVLINRVGSFADVTLLRLFLLVFVDHTTTILSPYDVN